jgi:glyoxylase-like metal-dependent hydrolase (beta-lactamase superfamily II)
MESYRVEQYVVGSVQTNCYFVIDEDTSEVLVIDPGASAKRLAAIIDEEKLNPAAILLTHGHFDHAGGASTLKEIYGIPVYAHESERETLEDPALNLSGWEGIQKQYSADIFLRDEQEIDLAGFHIRVLYTPGHTVGGCCYYFGYQNIVFAGDTLFAQSVGRTDFPKGSSSRLIRGIKDKLMILPDDTTVYTGHGDITTIGTERMYNPYL